MERKDLREEKGWVIVKSEVVFEYETFSEASTINSVMGGNLMSKSYYNNHYKKEQ